MLPNKHANGVIDHTPNKQGLCQYKDRTHQTFCFHRYQGTEANYLHHSDHMIITISPLLITSIVFYYLASVDKANLSINYLFPHTVQ